MYLRNLLDKLHPVGPLLQESGVHSPEGKEVQEVASQRPAGAVVAVLVDTVPHRLIAHRHAATCGVVLVSSAAAS